MIDRRGEEYGEMIEINLKGVGIYFIDIIRFSKYCSHCHWIMTYADSTMKIDDTG